MTVTASSRADRLRVLVAALEDRGLALRRDSALCEAFLNGSAHPDLHAEQVAEVCALHRFLYEYTSYAADCATALPPMACSLAGPMGSLAAAWRFVRDHEAPLLKMRAIEAVGGVPDVWPWMPRPASDRDARDEAHADEACVTGRITTC